MSEPVCPHDETITGLGERMASVETGLSNLTTAVVAKNNAIDNLAREISALSTLNDSVNTIWDFARKHGAKILSFAAGIMTVAGVGNPKVWHFITTFQWN